MPITWRNIDNPTLAQAAVPMQYATADLTNAFDRLGKVITDQQAVNQGAQDRQQEGQVLALKEALAGTKNPEQLTALKQSGTLDQMLQGITNPRYRAQVLGADDARMHTLYQQVQESNKYANDKLLNDNQQVIQNALAEAAKGNTDPANRLIAEHPDLPNLAEIVKAGVTGQRDLTKFTQQGEDHADKLLTGANQRTTSMMNAQAQQTMAGAAVTNANVNQQELGLKTAAAESARRAAALEAQDAALKKVNIVAAGDGLYTDASAARLRKALVDSKKTFDTPEDIDNLLAKINANKVMEIDVPDATPGSGGTKKVRVPVPYAMAEAAALASNDSWSHVGWNTGYADDAVSKIKNELRKTVLVNQRDAAGNVVLDKDGKPVQVMGNQVLEDLDAYNQYFRNRIANPGAAGKKKVK